MQTSTKCIISQVSAFQLFQAKVFFITGSVQQRQATVLQSDSCEVLAGAKGGQGGSEHTSIIDIYIYTCICHQPLTSCPLAPIPLHLLEDTTRKPSALLQVNVEFWETRVFVPRFCNTRVECSATLQFCQQCNVFCSQWTYLFLFQPHIQLC